MPVPDNRPWTVLVYMVADDERDQPAGTPSLNEIAKTQIQALIEDTEGLENVRVLCQVDFTDAAPKRCVFGSSSIEELREACTPGPETNAGDVRTMAAFFAWARSATDDYAKHHPEFKETRYAVIFWGHSAGPTGLFRDPAPWSLSPTLRLPDLAAAFSALGRYTDLVLFQNCWMSTLEVAYELRQAARYMIASQKIVAPMKLRWPYRTIFTLLTDSAAGDLQKVEQIANVLTHAYFNNVDESGKKDPRFIPFSALTLDAAASIAAPLKALGDALEGLDSVQDRERRALMTECAGDGGTNSGRDAALIDVQRVCKGLRHRENPICKPEALELERVLNTLIVGTTANLTYDKEVLTGVSLFRRPREKDMNKSVFGRSVSVHDYNELALTKATQWHRIAFEQRFE